MSYVNPNVIPSGTSFAQFQAGGASGQLERLIAVNSGVKSNPAVAATLSATAGGTAGGLLAPGVYYVNFTETNGYGETCVSAESGPVTVSAQTAPTGVPTVVVAGSGGSLPPGVYYGLFTYVDSNVNASGEFGETTAGAEFSFTQTGGTEPTIAINDGGLPSWASGRNLYLTAAGGASNTEVLAFTGISSTSYTVATAPAPSIVSPPLANTTTTNIPMITAFPALQPGNSARNIYLTPPDAGSGSEVLYYRESTSSTFAFAGAAPGSNYAVVPPAVNTTGFSTLDYQLIRAVKDGNLEDVYRRLRQLIYEWNHGSPVPPGQTLANLKRVHNAIAILAQLCSEMGTLIDANPGQIAFSQTGIGNAGCQRSWL